MNKFINPNPKVSIHALSFVENLRGALRSLVKLRHEVGRAKISLKNDNFNFAVWLSILSFMTRKICALYLGHTDYDFHFKDIQFSFTRKDFQNE